MDAVFGVRGDAVPVLPKEPARRRAVPSAPRGRSAPAAQGARMQMKWMIAAALAAAATAACGGGGAAPVTGGGPQTPDALASVTISHPEGAVPVGDTMILKVEARDGAGQPVTGITPQFTSSDAAVATVDGTGVVRGVKAGAASISASVTVGGITKTGNYGVAVLAPTEPSPPSPPPSNGI